MGHTHDVDVTELRAALAPVGMGHNEVTPHLSTGGLFESERHGPVEQRVEFRDPFARSEGFDVLKEGAKAANDFASVEFLSNGVKFFYSQVRFLRAAGPKIHRQFLRRELPFQRRKHLPFGVVELGHLDCERLGRLIGPGTRLHAAPPYMAHA